LKTLPCCFADVTANVTVGLRHQQAKQAAAKTLNIQVYPDRRCMRSSDLDRAMGEYERGKSGVKVNLEFAPLAVRAIVRARALGRRRVV
jgi:hypothetical protein